MPLHFDIDDTPLLAGGPGGGSADRSESAS
jgi:hypothetical protein